MIPAANRLERVSELRADPAAVWAAATDPGGINDEMRPLGGAARVRDRLGFELRGPLARVPGLARLSRAIVGALFDHRHRRLRRRDTFAA